MPMSFSLFSSSPGPTHHNGSSFLPKALADYIASVSHNHQSYPRIPVQVVSDLHLEFPESRDGSLGYASFTVPRIAPYLILAGDVGSLRQEDAYLEYLRRQCAAFERVFLVLGNHEFYGTSRKDGLAAIERFVEDPEIGGKLTLLHRDRFDLDENVTILGCTLQSHITPAQRDHVGRALNDFRLIQGGWNVDAHNAEHAIDLAWLREQLEILATEEPHRRVLIVTHHAPSFRKTSSPRHDGSPINTGFCTGILEGGEWRGWKGKEMVKTWVFGHTHWCTDVTISNVRVVSNQRGYLFEQPVREAFKDDFIIEV